MKGTKAMKSLMNKAYVKTHQRRTKTGKVVQVREHEDSRQKRQAADNKYAMAVGRTIQKQIGGQALYMIGAKGFGVGTQENGDAYLQFRIGRNDARIHMIRITLNQMDTYDVEFGRIGKGYRYTKVSEELSIYNEMLTDAIKRNTGMSTSLGSMGKGMMLLHKSRVKAHTRRVKSGKIVNIREHQDSRMTAEESIKRFGDPSRKPKLKAFGDRTEARKTQLASRPETLRSNILKYLNGLENKTHAVMLTNMSRHPNFSPAHFQLIQEAAEWLQQKGKINFNGVMLSLPQKDIREWSEGYGGKKYVTTDLELKGRGIISGGDSSTHARGLKTYHMTDAAFQKVQKLHGKFIYAKSIEGNMEDLNNYPLLQKAIGTVKQHQRRAKSGKITTVREHQKKTGEAGAKSPHQEDTTAYYEERRAHHEIRQAHHEAEQKKHKTDSPKWLEHEGASRQHEKKANMHHDNLYWSKKAEQRYIDKHSKKSKHHFAQAEKHEPGSDKEIEQLGWAVHHRKKADDASVARAARTKYPTKYKKSMENEPMDEINMDQYPQLKKAIKVGSLSKALEFTKSGNEIYMALMAKIGECQGELIQAVAKWQAGREPTNTDDMKSEESPVEVTNEEPSKEPYSVRTLRRKIKNLQRICRNIDQKKKFKLSEYELEEYGL